MTSVPVSDLQKMLAGMKPALDEAPYRFDAHGADEDLSALLASSFAMVREDEGITLITRAKDTEAGLLFARITLQVHSDLEAVGLTAAVSEKLASLGLPCNVIAGFHHDHIFVPWQDRCAALEALEQLSAEVGE